MFPLSVQSAHLLESTFKDVKQGYTVHLVPSLHPSSISCLSFILTFFDIHNTVQVKRARARSVHFRSFQI